MHAARAKGGDEHASVETDLVCARQDSLAVSHPEHPLGIDDGEIPHQRYTSGANGSAEHAADKGQHRALRRREHLLAAAQGPSLSAEQSPLPLAGQGIPRGDIPKAFGRSYFRASIAETS